MRSAIYNRESHKITGEPGQAKGLDKTTPSNYFIIFFSWPKIHVMF